MKIKIDNVAGVNEALTYMRYPKQSVSSGRVLDSQGGKSSDFKLADRLSVRQGGTGHDNYLTGIVVWLNITAPHYWWNQAQRYHWFQIVSSTSKMHTLATKPVKDVCTSNVSDNTIYLINVLLELYNKWDEPTLIFIHSILDAEDITARPTTKKELFEVILDNLPLGYQLTAGVVTNYLQLKNMYRQRKNHALSHWNEDFVAMIHELPMNALITK